LVNSNIPARNPKEDLNQSDIGDLKVGIDFDNTIVSYDALMYETAVSWRLLDIGMRRDKRSIRDQLRSLPDGENHWRRLQTYAYGEGMLSAHPMDGVMDFLHYCRTNGIPIWIVSHKTEYNNFGPPTVNLRQAAMTWLSEQGFFNEAITGLTPERVFFEPTREEKVARIAALAPHYFVDDLEETFQEPTFPSEVCKIHYVPHEESSSVVDAFHANSWSAILQFMQTHAAKNAGARLR
jgi:hypothetical protein